MNKGNCNKIWLLGISIFVCCLFMNRQTFANNLPASSVVTSEQNLDNRQANFTVQLPEIRLQVYDYFDVATQSYKIYLLQELAKGKFIYQNRDGYQMQSSVTLKQNQANLLHAIAYSDSKETSFGHPVFRGRFVTEISVNLNNNPILQLQTQQQQQILLQLKVFYPICSDYCVNKMLDIELPVNASKQDLTPIIQQLRSEVQQISVVSRNDVSPDNLWLILGCALLGGLLLNCMPCIFPVLSIKILSIVKFSHKPSQLKLAFLATSAGIITTITTLGVILSLLRHMGYLIGWGSYFQNIYLLMALVIIMTLFAGSFLGLININYATFTNFVSRHFTTKHIQRQNIRLRIILDNFLAGIVIVLLSTPCSAPFLGVATSYALVHGSYPLILIFLMIGIGLSVPYLFLLCFPRLLQYLPKSGRWLRKMEYIMGFIVLLTVVWLLQLIFTSGGTVIFFKTIYFVIALLFHQKIIQILHFPSQAREQQLTRFFFIVLVVGTMGLPYFNRPTVSNTTTTTPQYVNNSLWQNFTLFKLQDALAQNKIVIIKITANWCITCQVNENMVFETQEIQRLLTNPQVVALKGDLTHANPQVNAYLALRKRFAIPYTVIYSSQYPQGLELPDVLTKKHLQNVLHELFIDR